MKITKIHDERVLAESDKIFKICFFILCAGIFLDLVIKFSLWQFGSSGQTVDKDGVVVNSGNSLSFFIVMGLEAVFLVGSFLTNIFMLAKKGIAFGSQDLDCERFPKKRYFLICGSVGSAIPIVFLTTRFILDFRSANSLWFDILFTAFIYLLVAAIAFIVLYLLLYITFRIAKRNSNVFEKEE